MPAAIRWTTGSALRRRPRAHLVCFPQENKLRKRRHVGSGCAIARYSAAARHHFRLHSVLRHGGGGGATVRPCHGECATMIVIGLIVSAFGIGFLCWLMFTLAVYALPFFAGITVGLAVYHSGAGVVGAPVVGFAAGAVTLVVGRFAFAVLKLRALRGAIAFLFAA